MDPSTIKQLDEWMVSNCYNDRYAIANRNIHEGYGLDESGNRYTWYYTERGVRQNLHSFETEREAVAFAFKTITADPSAKRHMVGFIKKAQETALITELQNRNIEFWKDQIPYGGPDDLRIRVFVFGCDVKKVSDLQETYGLIQ